MIPRISGKENIENAVNINFIYAIKELGISSLLRQCRIRKDSRRQKGEASGEKRFKVLVIDDPVINHNRSKRVELLAFIFDHVTGKSVKGFNLLTYRLDGRRPNCFVLSVDLDMRDESAAHQLIDLIFKNNMGVCQNEKGCYVLFKKRKVLIQWKSGRGFKSV